MKFELSNIIFISNIINTYLKYHENARINEQGIKHIIETIYKSPAYSISITTFLTFSTILYKLFHNSNYKNKKDGGATAWT